MFLLGFFHAGIPSCRTDVNDRHNQFLPDIESMSEDRFHSTTGRVSITDEISLASFRRLDDVMSSSLLCLTMFIHSARMQMNIYL